MSSSSNDSTTASSLQLSPHEFSRLLLDPEMIHQVSRALDSDPLHSVITRYFCYASQAIDRLEFELEIHRREQGRIFDRLFENQTFQDRIRPIVQNYRRRNMHHPYNRTPSPPHTPSDDNSSDPPSSYRILPEEALARIATPDNSCPTPSNHAPIDEETGSRGSPDDQGLESRQSPFDVEDDEGEESYEEDEENPPSLHYP